MEFGSLNAVGSDCISLPDLCSGKLLCVFFLNFSYFDGMHIVFCFVFVYPPPINKQLTNSSIAGLQNTFSVDAEIPDNAERKKIVIPSASPAFNRNTIVETSERKKITVLPSSVNPTVVTPSTITPSASRPATASPIGYSRSPDTIQESAERKKIVIPRPTFSAKQTLEPKAYADKDTESERETKDVNDGPKPYVASETFRLVQDLDKQKSDTKLKPFGSASSQTQGRSFTLLQKQLE